MKGSGSKGRKVKSDFIETWLFPELKRIRYPSARPRTMKLAMKSARRQHSRIIWAEILVGFAILLSYFPDLIPGGILGHGSQRWGFLAIAWLGAVAILMHLRRTVRLELRRILNYDFWCHRCDYWLQDNTTGICRFLMNSGV